MSLNSIGSLPPFPDIKNFQYAIQQRFMEYGDIFLCAQVCKLWNSFIETPCIWEQFFKAEGIPFVESPDGTPRDLKADFRILSPMTISLKMGMVFGNVPGEIPFISNECFKKCFQEDPFETGRLMKDTFMFVVLPGAFKRTFCREFPYTLDEAGNLKRSHEYTGQTIRIPNGVHNLSCLSKLPVNTSIVGTVDLQCRLDETRCDEIRVLFMKKNIAAKSMHMPYSCQKEIVEAEGFEVTSLRVRAFSEVVHMSTFRRRLGNEDIHTSDTVEEGDLVYQALIYQACRGSIGVCSGADFNNNDCNGVVPSISAEV